MVWQGDLPAGVGEAELKAAKWMGDDRDDQNGVLKIVVGGRTVTLTVQQQAVAPKPGRKTTASSRAMALCQHGLPRRKAAG
ncbi:hypothetical protein ACU4GD_12025 [Cupriavidus basilensis]